MDVPGVTGRKTAPSHLPRMGDLLGLIFLASVGGAIYYAGRTALRALELAFRKPWDRWRPTRF